MAITKSCFIKFFDFQTIFVKLFVANGEPTGYSYPDVTNTLNSVTTVVLMEELQLINENIINLAFELALVCKSGSKIFAIFALLKPKLEQPHEI